MRYFGLSDIGKRRSINQDSFIASYNVNNDFIAVVCDGIGGGNAGDVASRMACDLLLEEFLKNPNLTSKQQAQDWLKEAIQRVNDAIFTKASQTHELSGMGTTMVGVLMCKLNVYVFNIGDSRAYLLQDELKCLTEDHNLLHELIHSGQIDMEEEINHPKRNMLTNALGIWNQVRVDISLIDESFDYLLLCSDGLHGYVSEKLVKAVLLSRASLMEKVENLIQLANDIGGYDNVTVVLIDEKGDTYE